MTCFYVYSIWFRWLSSSWGNVGKCNHSQSRERRTKVWRDEVIYLAPLRSRTKGVSSSVTFPQMPMVQILVDYPRSIKNTVDGQVLIYCLSVSDSANCVCTWGFLIPPWENYDIKWFLWKPRKSLLFWGRKQNSVNCGPLTLKMLKNL